MSTPTPAPWEADGVQVWANDEPILMVRCRLSMMDPNFQKAWQEACATTRLAAACHEMRAVCQELIRSFPNGGHPGGFIEALLAKARAALAKADGEQQP